MKYMFPLCADLRGSRTRRASGLGGTEPLATPRGVNLKRGALLLALALSACATHPRVATVYCLTPPQLQKLKDAEPERIGPKLSGQAQDDLKLIAGNNVELRRYGQDLLGVLGGCVGE